MNSQLAGETTNLDAIREGSGVTSGVPDGELLSRLVELTLDDSADNTDELAGVRDAIVAAMDAPALVDAAAVIGNFQRMVRIADGTGIPLDKQVAMISADVRDELRLNEFGSANLTPAPGPIGRLLGRHLRPLLIKGIQMGRRQPAADD